MDWQALCFINSHPCSNVTSDMFIVSRIWAYLDRIFEDVSDVFLGHFSVERVQFSDNIDDRSAFAQLRKRQYINNKCLVWMMHEVEIYLLQVARLFTDLSDILNLQKLPRERTIFS